MIKRIDLFMPPLGQYGVLHHFTKKLYEALMRCGVNCRLLEAERTNPRPFLTQLFNDPPDCTLSFNGLLPDNEDRFFCDMIKIPHVACLVDSPNHFFPLIRSSYNIITCVDRFSCDFFKGMKHENVIFMPHGVEKNLNFNPETPRDIDLIFLASYIDYEKIANEWKKKYSPALNKILLDAAKISLLSSTTSYVEALVECVRDSGNEDIIQKLDYVELLDELEMYIRGMERVL
ncbi:MAG: glycosyltransferase family 1 protein, partial [Parachlamydiaceae bacterium]|nr:glycosyltransferase family 1 protein [Parachlamydiaceae bacterium]